MAMRIWWDGWIGLWEFNDPACVICLLLENWQSITPRGLCWVSFVQFVRQDMMKHFTWDNTWWGGRGGAGQCRRLFHWILNRKLGHGSRMCGEGNIRGKASVIKCPQKIYRCGGRFYLYIYISIDWAIILRIHKERERGRARLVIYYSITPGTCTTPPPPDHNDEVALERSFLLELSRVRRGGRAFSGGKCHGCCINVEDDTMAFNGGWRWVHIRIRILCRPKETLWIHSPVATLQRHQVVLKRWT